MLGFMHYFHLWGPPCLQNGKHSGRRKDSHRNPLGEKNHFELVLQCVKGTLVQLGALCCFPRTENYPVAPASPGSPLCAWRSIQEVREENERTPTGWRPRALSKQHLLCKVILECPQAWHDLVLIDTPFSQVYIHGFGTIDTHSMLTISSIF